MSRYISILLLLVFNSWIGFSQKFEWAGAFNGWDKVFGYSVAVDQTGNVLTTGIFEGTVDFDPGPGVYNLSSNGQFDAYITKLDKDGKFLWAISFGGNSTSGISSYQDAGYSISTDKDGNVYVCGAFEYTVDFDPGPGVYNITFAGGNDLFILKLDPYGQFVWVKTFGSGGYDVAFSLSFDIDQNIYILGLFSGILDFDPGPSFLNLDASTGRTFVLKMDTNGNTIWAKNFNTNYTQSFYSPFGNSIATDKNGNILITDSFYSTVDFDPGPGVYNLTGYNGTGGDIYILKLDNNGNFVWAKKISISVGPRLHSYAISCDNYGNVYVTGEFGSSTDFDPDTGIYNLTTSNTTLDIFISKLDANGNFVWAKQMGGANDDVGFSVTTDKFGNVYTTGKFDQEGDFDPGPGVYTLKPSPITTYCCGDMFVSKLDSNGDFVWAIGIGDTKGYWYLGQSVFIDKNINVYLTGRFYQPGDFDPGPGTYILKTTNFENAFVLKLSQCQPTSDTTKVNSCHSYTWLDGKTYTESTDTARYIIQNKAGCDSIITLDLTILKPDSTTIYHEACKNYEWKGYTYNQSGIYQYDTINLQGCDSTVLLNLTIIKPDTASVAYIACDSYLWHNKEYDQSGTFFFDTLSIRGCDSTVILNLTINNSKKTESFQISCDSLLWHGNTYTQSGIYEYKTQTISGCDSIITLNLIVNRSDEIMQTETACNSYSWNGTTYMQSGTYTYQTINNEGCDSTITLELTINNQIKNTTSLNICEGDSIEVFGNWIDQAAILTDTFTTSAGCDSIQTFDISVIPLPRGQITSSICEGDSIFIIDRWLSKEGNYSIRKSNINSCDSLINVDISLIKTRISFDTIGLCRGDTIIMEGNTITDQNDITQHLTSRENCDSLVNTHIRMLEPSISQNDIKLCPGDSILISGNWIKSDAQIEEHFTATNTCDSTAITTISLLPEPQNPEIELDCESREVTVSIAASQDWQILWDNGSKNPETTYQDKAQANVTLTSIPGCDRTYTLTLPEIPDITLIKVPNDTMINRIETLTIDLGLSPDAWQITWTPTENVDCETCSKVNIAVDKNTEFAIKLTHESGCEYEIRFRVKIEKINLDIPNIFSPDGDDKNDQWKVKIPSDIDLISCSIFDRWGEQVYTTSGIINWDGTFKGKKAMSGVYVYVIEYRDEEGKSAIITGDVTVVR